MARLNTLTELQDYIDAKNSNRRWAERLLFNKSREQIHIDFHGDPQGDVFFFLLDLMCQDEISEKLTTLSLHGLAMGANGVRLWNFTHLLDTEVVFPKLTSLYVEQHDQISADHPIIGGINLKEQGMIGQLLTKAPRLISLTVPSAPSKNFFQVDQHPLQELHVQAGLAHQDFILHLSESACFSNLSMLDFTDFGRINADNSLNTNTPFPHFIKLFQSPAFSSMRTFIVRESSLSKAELLQLKSLRSELILCATWLTIEPI